MKYREFRFDTLHKQYLYFPGEVPLPGQFNQQPSDGFLAYCFSDENAELICLLLGTVRFRTNCITPVCTRPAAEPVCIPSSALAERTCMPLRRDAFDLSTYAWAETIADDRDPQPKSDRPVPLSKICGVCTHHHGRFGWQTCDAFPEHIPVDIWNAELLPLVPCRENIGFCAKPPRLFIEAFDAASGRVIYRYSAEGDPLHPQKIQETSDLSDASLQTFRRMMQDWRAHLPDQMKEVLHCRDEDGAFAAELSVINVVMTINRMTGRDVYRIIDEFPDYPEP